MPIKAAQSQTTPTPMSELPEDVMKIFLRSEKYFRQYQNCSPTEQSKTWWKVIKAFDEVLGLMDTFEDYQNQAYLNGKADGKREDRKRLIEEIRVKNFEYMEPCEPDCDAVRHARHEGSWAHYFKMDQYLEALSDTTEAK